MFNGNRLGWIDMNLSTNSFRSICMLIMLSEVPNQSYNHRMVVYVWPSFQSSKQVSIVFGRSARIDRSHSHNVEGIVHRMFRNFRLGTIHVNIAVVIPSSESMDVIAFQFLNRRLASVSQIITKDNRNLMLILFSVHFRCEVDTCKNLYGCYFGRLHGLTRLTHFGPKTGTLKFAQIPKKNSDTNGLYEKTKFLCGPVSRICKYLRPAQRYGQFKFKKAILSWTLYAWNDNELIAPPPTDPIQLLFCTPYLFGMILN